MSRLPLFGEPLQKGLLAFLSEEEFSCLLPKMEKVYLLRGQVVHEPGRCIDYLYFPTSAIVSISYIAESGAIAEMGLVGSDGAVGIALLLGAVATPFHAIVQFEGGALRMN